MPSPTRPFTRLAIPQADKADLFRSVSKGFIEHPKIAASKGVFTRRCRTQFLRHDVPTPGAFLDPKKLLSPIFAGEVDRFLDEFLLHHRQVDFQTQFASQTGFRKKQITAAS